MKLGIIGKPQSGKTTVFNAASGQQEAVGDFSKATHRAIIKVPDERLEKLAELVNPKKITYAEIEFLDAPGFSGKGKESTELEISSDLRQMDALMLVLDAFSPEANPKADMQDIVDEMILADQVMIETNIERRIKKIKTTNDKTAIQEVELLKKCLAHLEEEKLLIDIDISKDERKSLRGYMFMTEKPLLVVVNLAEDKIGNASEYDALFSDFISENKREVTSLCGKIEMELIALDEDDRTMFMEELGIKSPAVDIVVQKSYNLLGLISYLTAGEPEVRAWTIRKGFTAQKSAGVIHSDIERGFIRAEVIKYDDYIELGSEKAVKAAGKFRLEGKEYIVGDGDVILFRFNV